jgi:hypothetical protein
MGLSLGPGQDATKAVCTSGCLNVSSGYAITKAQTCADPPYQALSWRRLIIFIFNLA